MLIPLHKAQPPCNGHLLIVHTLEDVLPDEVTFLAKELTSLPEKTIAILAGIHPVEQKFIWLLFLIAISQLAGNHLKSILPTINGKGGGNIKMLQGGGTSLNQLHWALNSLKDAIADELSVNN